MNPTTSNSSRFAVATLLTLATLGPPACDRTGRGGVDSASTPTTAQNLESDETSADSAPERPAEPNLSAETFHSVIDLRALRRDGAFDALETVRTTVDGPVYDKPETFEGWRLETVLHRHADLPDSTKDYVVQFVATDGYRATLSLEAAMEAATEAGGILAFRGVDAPEGRDWTPFTKGDRQTTPAPFYLVWPEPASSDTHLPWAYKVAKIGIARAKDLWGEAVPTHDASLQAGFAVFRDHCMKCHSVNRSGGSVGPELNVPKNVTEYWQPDELPKYIRHPRAYRADAEMPAMDANLSKADMKALLEYLRGMKEAKVCETPRACEKYRQNSAAR